MSESYTLAVTGIRDGLTPAEVASALARLFRRSEDQVLQTVNTLVNRTDGKAWVIRQGADLATVQRMYAGLYNCGCICEIDPSIHLAADFSSIALRQFASEKLGLEFEAPAHWEDTSGQHFQVTDSDTDTEFTGNGAPVSGLSLQQWAEMRLGAVTKSMPSMKTFKQAYGLQLHSLPGIVAEYRGTFPGYRSESHYLVLCLCRGSKAASLTISTEPAIFDHCRALYFWLLQNKLELRD